MATTGVNIVKYLVASLIGTTVKAINALSTMNPLNAKQLELSGQLTRLDVVSIDLSASSYAKNGGCSLALTGTTAVDLNLQDLTSNTDFSAGDTTYSTANQFIFKNNGAADVTIKTGAANGFNFGLAGTTPTLTVPANSSVTIQSAAGLTVDSTHKIITVTPTSGGSFSMCVGGA
jgi:hypothetical protein